MDDYSADLGSYFITGAGTYTLPSSLGGGTITIGGGTQSPTQPIVIGQTRIGQTTGDVLASNTMLWIALAIIGLGALVILK